MNNPFDECDTSPEQGAQPANYMIAGQTGAGKSTLMINLYKPFMTPPEDGEPHE